MWLATQVLQDALAADKPVPERLLTGCLLTGAQLALPSLHLIGVEDPNRPFSENMLRLFSDAPTPLTSSVYGIAANTETSGFKQVLMCPNAHMPPRKSEFALALRNFAHKWRELQL